MLSESTQWWAGLQTRDQHPAFSAAKSADLALLSIPHSPCLRNTYTDSSKVPNPPTKAVTSLSSLSEPQSCETKILTDPRAPTQSYLLSNVTEIKSGGDYIETNKDRIIPPIRYVLLAIFCPDFRHELVSELT